MKSLLLAVWKNHNFLSMFGNVVFAGVAFLSFAILARSYNTQIFGKYMLFVSGGAFLEMLRFGLTRTSIVKYLSGVDKSEQKAFVGANYLIGLGATLLINVLLWLVYFLGGKQVLESGFSLFLIWYPWMALANIPMNNAVSLLQAHIRFDRILFIRAFASVSFFLYAAFNFFIVRNSIEITIVVQIGTQLLTSIVCAMLGWDGMGHLLHTSREAVMKLLHFGKFSMGTLISTSLLKSADTFILGLMPAMGVSAVAIYSVPLKLTELFEIPLRSFTATVYPRMSKAVAVNDKVAVTSLFYDYVGMLSLLFIPLLLVCEVFASVLVLLFGGEQYLVAVPIFRVYMLYGLFLTMDRLTGVALDSLGVPKYNLYKVVLMASINIVGDILAVVLFKSLLAVATVTVLNTFIGALVGYRILKRFLPLNFSTVITRGWYFIMSKKGVFYERFS
jgi:O-antigen/teichoic acid export membrane protein